MHRSGVATAVVIVALGITTGLAVGAGAQTSCDTHVSPNESIQAAVDDAEEGSTICVEDGTYEESVSVNVAGLTLTPVDEETDPEVSYTPTIVNGTPTVNIEADGVTVEGFTIERIAHPDREADSNHAQGVAVRAGNVTVADNEIVGDLSAVDNAFNRFDGLMILDDGPIHDVSLRNNNVSGFFAGTVVTSFFGNVIDGVELLDNKIDQNEHGFVGKTHDGAVQPVDITGSGNSFTANTAQNILVTEEGETFQGYDVTDFDTDEIAFDGPVLVEDGDSLQTAVDVAAEDAEVHVGPGSYDEQVVVDVTGLHVIGEDGASVSFQPEEQPNGQPTVNVLADGATVEGLTAEREAHPDRSSQENPNFAQGIRVSASDVLIRDTIVEGVAMDDENNKAIMVLDDGSVTGVDVVANDVSAFEHGIGAVVNAGGDVTALTFANNDVTGTNVAIAAAGAVSDVSVTGNQIEGADVGLAVWPWSGETPSDVQATGNTLADNGVQAEDLTGENVLDLESTLANNDFDQAVVVRENPIKVPTIFSSIQDAVDAAEAGDIVDVRAGTYEEDVSVDVTDLSMEGSNAGIPGDGDRSDEATILGQVVLSTDGITFDGFDVSPPAATSNQGSEALRISNSPDGVVVTNNVVHDFSENGLGDWLGIEGIVAFGGDDTDGLEDVTISANAIHDLEGLDEKGGAAGIMIQGNVSGATVRDNVVSDIGLQQTAWAHGIVVTGTGNHDVVPQDVDIADNELRRIRANPATEWHGVGVGIETAGEGYNVLENDVGPSDLGVETKGDADATDARINYNDLSLADIAIVHQGGGELLAPYNYYDGCEVPTEGDVHTGPVLSAAPVDLVPDPLTEDIFEYSVCAEIPADTTAAISTPAPQQQTLGDVVDAFDGGTVLLFDEVLQTWVQADGTETLDPMEPALLTTGDEPVTAELSFPASEQAQPTERSVTEGWNFLGPRTAADAEIGFSTATVDQTDLVHVYEEPDVSMPLETTASPHYAFDSSTEAPQVSPFTGFFVYADEDGTVPGALTDAPSHTDFYDVLGLPTGAVAGS